MKALAVGVSALVLAGCLPHGNDPDKINPKIVVASASPDYATSDIAVIGDSESTENIVVEGKVSTTNPSDIRIGVFGDWVFRLGRYGFDNVTAFRFNQAQQSFYVDTQYSVLGDELSANPYDFAAVNYSNAYISRYDSPFIWQVNPLAKSADSFKLAEVDLSDFQHESTAHAFAADLELVGDQLYVLVTSLDQSWSATEVSKVIVIDTADNSVVDTNTEEAGTQVISLPIKNASDFERNGDDLYISGVGDAYAQNLDNKYSGGIVKLSTVDYSVSLILDDGDSNDAPYGNITNVAVTPGEDVYFSGSLSYGDDKLFVLKNGATSATEVELGEGAYNIADLAIDEGELYVAVAAQYDGSEDAGLKIVSIATGLVTGMIEMSYNPTQIVLVD